MRIDGDRTMSLNLPESMFNISCTCKYISYMCPHGSLIMSEMVASKYIYSASNKDIGTEWIIELCWAHLSVWFVSKKEKRFRNEERIECDGVFNQMNFRESWVVDVGRHAHYWQCLYDAIRLWALFGQWIRHIRLKCSTSLRCLHFCQLFEKICGGITF